MNREIGFKTFCGFRAKKHSAFQLPVYCGAKLSLSFYPMLKHGATILKFGAIIF
jgi:hypothetical protein